MHSYPENGRLGYSSNTTVLVKVMMAVENWTSEAEPFHISDNGGIN